MCAIVFFFQAEDGIRDLVRSRGLGDVYKRQGFGEVGFAGFGGELAEFIAESVEIVCEVAEGRDLSLIHI